MTISRRTVFFSLVVVLVCGGIFFRTLNWHPPSLRETPGWAIAVQDGNELWVIASVNQLVSRSGRAHSIERSSCIVSVSADGEIRVNQLVDKPAAPPHVCPLHTVKQGLIATLDNKHYLMLKKPALSEERIAGWRSCLPVFISPLSLANGKVIRWKNALIGLVVTDKSIKILSNDKVVNCLESDCKRRKITFEESEEILSRY